MEYKAGSKLSWSGCNGIVLSDNKILIQGGIGNGQILSLQDWSYIVGSEMVSTTPHGLLPIPLEAMQQSKAEEDEKKYKKAIKDIITNIYTQAVQAAKTSTTSRDQSVGVAVDRRGVTHIQPHVEAPAPQTTSYRHPVHLHQPQMAAMSTHIKSTDTLTEVLSALRELFPGCRVTYSKMARGVNGQMHDITQMDELTTKLIEMKVIDTRHVAESILIDWSLVKAEEQAHG